MTSPLTVSQLFTPMPSGVGPFGQVPGNPASETWYGVMLTVAGYVQLPTTSWQPGAPERSILAIEAVTFSQSDAEISKSAQGAFLQSAASGSVTFVTVDGTTISIPVTPDPSNPAQNPGGQPGWLDLLAQSTYNVTRLNATAASGPLALVNLQGTTYNYGAGAYHAKNTATGATYTNPSALAIPSSAIPSTGGVIVGVTPGLQNTTIVTQSAHGLAPGQTVYITMPSGSVLSIFQANPTPGSGFALVTGVTTTSFTIGVPSSGSYGGGGTVYLCTVATMTADVIGLGGNAGPGTVTTNITQNAGVFTSNVIGWSGSNYESNAALVSRTTLSIAAASPNGPSQAYVYFAETAAQLLAAQATPYTLTNGPVQATEFATPSTGVVTTVVASSTPASTTLGQAVTPGCAQLLITGFSNANPCAVSCSGPHNLTTGMTVAISGSIGPAALDALVVGSFVATVVDATHFSIPVNTTSAGTWTGGGSVEGGDLGAIDALLQTNVVPDCITAVTESALALPVSIVATVVVPQVYVTAYALAVQVQLAAQLASYAVGGNAPGYAVAYNDIVGALEEAGVISLGSASYVRQIQALSINGQASGLGVSFPSSQYQALLVPPTITVVGV